MDLQRRYPNFFVLDLFNVFCSTDICKFYNEEGIFLYRDESSHPSVEANLLAQPFLIEVVNKAIRSASMGSGMGDLAHITSDIK
jgi:hypothetical protein